MDNIEISENIDEIGKCIDILANENYKNLPDNHKKLLARISYLLPNKEEFTKNNSYDYSIGFKISLNKFIFMIHLLYYKNTGKKLTNLKFYRYKYGPYNSAIIDNTKIDLSIIDFINLEDLKRDIIKDIGDISGLLKDVFSIFSSAKSTDDLVIWSHKLDIFQGTPYGYEIKLESYDCDDLLGEINYDYKEADTFAEKVINMDRYRANFNKKIASFKGEY